jgi:serine/threonine protein kinase
MPLRARDLQTAQTVWLRDVLVPPEALEQALTRAQAAKGIFHPSLVTLFDVLPAAADRLVLAYEYVPAQTLAEVSGGLAINPKRAAEILWQVADAVAELHARNVAHGAISQATVLITMKGKAKLDRVADPSLDNEPAPTPESDLVALGALLRGLVGQTAGRGVAGMQAIEVVIERARTGRFSSAATFAAMLRTACA